ncbi:MAG: glycoside hydrolase family 3 N-terminal domain-containing protein [Verrucomicrobiae bacterium]
MKRILFTLGVLAQSAAFAPTAVMAETTPAAPPTPVVTFDSQVTNPSGSQAPGDQYIFFAANAKPGDKWGEDPAMNLVKLTDFSVSAPLANSQLMPPEANNPAGVKVIAPGGAPVVATGLLGCNRSGDDKKYADMATFRITNPAVTSFSIWVLDSTTKVRANVNEGLAIRVNGCAPVAPCATVKTDSANEFSKFTITGASISDVFTVAVLSSDGNGAHRTLAGLTFSVIPDPSMAGKKFPVIEQQGWNDLNKNAKKDVYEDPYQPVEKRVENLLKQMTLEEKLGQLNQLVTGDRKNDQALFPLMRRGEVSSYIWGRGVPADRNQFQRIAVQESRLGIPILFGMDIIHGATTLFPIALGLSCSFDPELLERAQTVAARETRAEGVEWVFAPMCDLARDPRWGRVAETCGEDPYLSSLCNAAQVRGFQGTNPAAPDRVAACLKHYVGYSAVTGGRDYNDSEITEWTLRNAHLPSFDAGVKAGALTIMSSFNAIDGIPAAANHHAMTEILRDEWKFKGFVVSDWLAVEQLVNWGYAKDKADAARLAINAGNDMDMKSEAYVPNLAAEIKAGRVSLATVDEAVRRVLRVKFQVGLFERPYVDESAYKAAQKKPEDIALARECVTKSTVLLKNTGILPLSKELKKIALIGPVGDDHREILGCWTGRTSWSKPTLASALKEALPTDATLTVVKGCAINTVPTTKTLQDGKIVPDESVPPTDADLKIDEAVAAAKDADVVIMAVGETKGFTGENASRAFLTLTGNQQALFDAVAATGKPVVTIVFSGRPLALPEVWEKSAAVFYAWQPGGEAGSGLADLLLGNVAPSARLSMSVPRHVGQVPIYYNYYNTGRPRSGQYRDMKDMDAKFWFGYGLTYTTFEYSPVKITPAANGKSAEATVTITNTGKREGIEVPQLYIRQLVCHEGARPKQELRGFKRVKLQPGEKADLSFPLTGDVLGYIDRKGNPRVDAGDYEIWIAPSAHAGTPAAFNLTPRD